MSTIHTSSPATFSSFAELSLRQTSQDALSRMNITTPTRIQAETLPVLLDGRDVIGQSRTGSGKTLAFGIPAVESVDPGIKAVQVLVLTPTRELAVQVGDVLSNLCTGTGIRTVLVYGGRAMGPQKDALRRGAQIVVGTPGRVADLYGQGDLRLNNVNFLVLDEADEMLDRGFRPQVEQILGWTPATRQTALFSATMPDWVNDASKRHLRNPHRVVIESTVAESQSIDHIAYDVPAGGKMDALKDLLDGRGDGQVIVFGRTKHGVKKLAKQLAASGYPVAALQGNMSQNARDTVMEEFRAGKVPVLLATNVAARGIDVSAVDYVINFELPESSELLSHRIGRTGRMGRSGQAITLLGDEDTGKWRQLERGLGKRIQREPWTGARRTDSTPRIVTHAPIAQATATERRAPNRERDGNGRRDERVRSERRPQGESQRGTAPRPQRRDAERQEQSAPQPVRRPRSSISIIDQMIAEKRGPNDAPPAITQAPFPRPEAARSERQPRREGGERRQRPDGRSGNGSGPRGPQVTPTVRRPSFGPVARAEAVIGGAFEHGEARQPERNGARAAAKGGTHTATCTECGTQATLRFAPDLSRPVYCDVCFSKRRTQNRAAR
ncbi:MAG: DEAD/DEAH box helicase [Chloroflexota bacterium]|nr:DEAD/DEAH box helicase [Chloroflexota bacterium]